MSDIILVNPSGRGVANFGVVNEVHIEPAPISRLPPEILEDIFTLCVSWLYAYQKPKNRLAWMQVCREWQHIGLNCGRLWQHIDLNSICAAQFLVRSRQAPLYITATSSIKTLPLDLALHASRLHTIDVTFFQADMVQLFMSVGQDLPMLANLSLARFPVTPTLIINLSLPSLRRLSLEGVSIRWEECRNLTHLSLRGEYHAFFPSLSRLFAIFDSSPDLEYVRLEGIVLSSSDTAESPPINLCHLKNFMISSYASVIRSILSTVNFGTQTRLQLHVPQIEDLRSIFPSSRLQFPGTCAEYQQHPPTRCKDVNHVRLSRYAVWFIQNDSPSWCDEPSKLRISLTSASPVSMHVCRSLDAVIELMSIARLELCVGVLLDIPQHVLKNLFRGLQRLQSLCTAFNEIMDLLHILESIDDTTRLVYLPHLVRLSFGKPADTWWHFGDDWTELIVDTLRTRRERACGLQILEFFSCRELTPARIEALERVADEVVVIEQPGSDGFF